MSDEEIERIKEIAKLQSRCLPLFLLRPLSPGAMGLFGCSPRWPLLVACMSPLPGTKVLQTQLDLEESQPQREPMWTERVGDKGTPGQVGGWCVGECLEVCHGVLPGWVLWSSWDEDCGEVIDLEESEYLQDCLSSSSTLGLSVYSHL